MVWFLQKTPELFKAVRNAADRGKPYNQESHGNVVASLNFNMDELHATIGRAQLKKLPGIVEKRRAFAQMLKDKGIADGAIVIPELLPGTEHSYWWWRLGVDENKLTCSKKEFCEALLAEGLLLAADYSFALPFTFDWFTKRADQHPWNNPLYKGDPAQEPDTPNALMTTKNFFNLSISEGWNEKDADDIIAIVRKVEKAYLK